MATRKVPLWPLPADVLDEEGSSPRVFYGAIEVCPCEIRRRRLPVFYGCPLLGHVLLCDSSQGGHLAGHSGTLETSPGGLWPDPPGLLLFPSEIQAICSVWSFSVAKSQILCPFEPDPEVEQCPDCEHDAFNGGTAAALLNQLPPNSLDIPPQKAQFFRVSSDHICYLKHYPPELFGA